MAASFTRRRFGSKGCQRCVWPFACSIVIPFLPPPSLHDALRDEIRGTRKEPKERDGDRGLIDG